MLTLFTTPKAFRGHIDIIQRNAIRSWQLLQPNCEVILIGNDPGTAEVAKEFGVRHIPNVAQNSIGTPLVSSVFAEAQKVASHSMLCYVNADIIFMSDFLRAVRCAVVQKPNFLLVGRRWDSEVREPLDFRPGWETLLTTALSENGRLHGHTGIDYFVFPRGLWSRIPPFAIGRGAWDNWLIYQAKSEGAAVIDLTPVATIAHQNHDYAHVSDETASQFMGLEAAQNFALAGGYSHLYTVADASYQLTHTGIRRRLTPYYFYRALVTLSVSHRSALWLLKALRSSLGAVRGEKDYFALE